MSLVDMLKKRIQRCTQIQPSENNWHRRSLCSFVDCWEGYKRACCEQGVKRVFITVQPHVTTRCLMYELRKCTIVVALRGNLERG